MCQNAEKTAAELMQEIEPTLVSLLELEGIANTPDGQAAINAYNAALTAVQNWVPGTTSQTVVQLINAFTAVFDTLPIPTEAIGLENLIAAGVVTVITVITANSPTTAATSASEQGASAEEIAKVQEIGAHEIANSGEAQVEKLTGLKASAWDKARAALGDTHVAAARYRSEWNKGCETMGGKYVSLKLAA